MNFDKPITRRESIKKMLKLSGSLALAGGVTWPHAKPLTAATSAGDKKFILFRLEEIFTLGFEILLKLGLCDFFPI